ncbi:protein adenylyltransferase SelO [Neolewinella persica]|uniref:protein adenylyltransferase SelO n=1 Tax=Neolewinella persica TaxID=70998 RepID=UPI0003719F26|nr:YdiU family protein [Neolewinella persica]
MNLNIADTFNRELPADPDRTNEPRQVKDACFSFVKPSVPGQPKLVHYSKEMVEAIGLTEADATSEEFLKIFSGAKVLEGTDPYAMCYGGHQFGHWAGQLGDGRAINLGEVVHAGNRWALQLKGAGTTPYSRTADGLAVLRSSIREHLCSEAMHHLGVPTTRSVSLALSGDEVLRDVMYNGNAAYEKGAIVCRAAPSFIRFGNFEIFARRGDVDSLRKLTDYTIRHFFPEIEQGTKAGYIAFFKEVARRTLDMIIHWQRVGFVHGVMNTDNLSILGLTIDFGPYGWLEGYDDNWTPNTTDRSHRRYRFGNQPHIGLWNLAQLGSALVPLIEEVKPLQAVLEAYKAAYQLRYLSMMRQKLGLQTDRETDDALVGQLVATLQLTETDMTIFFRNLSEISQETSVNEGTAFLAPVLDAFYEPDALTGETLAAWQSWFNAYVERLGHETATAEERRASMHSVNPKYVLRNYMAQLAIDKADAGDYTLINDLHQLLKRPYDEQPEAQEWFARRPEWARNRVGCSMLSCSS